MKAVILAAEQSKNLWPFTETRATAMIHLGRETLLGRTLVGLRYAGIEEVYIVVRHCQEEIRKFFGYGGDWGLRIGYVEQGPEGGIGNALWRCEEMLQGEPFLLIYGDVLTTGPIFESVLSRYMEHGDAVAAISLPQISADFGTVYIDEEMRITRWVEKSGNPQLANYVLAGVYALPEDTFSLLRRYHHRIEDCYRTLIDAGRMACALWEGKWIDVRHPWQILEANRLVMDTWEEAQIAASVRMEGSVHIRGPVHMEAGVRIEAGSVVIGPCFLGRGCYVGHHALVREYSSLGPGSVVGYGSELKNCVLFGQSDLGRLSYIADSVLGEHVFIGTGVTTVNTLRGRSDLLPAAQSAAAEGLTKLGAFLGDGVSIGARHVLAPGLRVAAGEVQPDRFTLSTDSPQKR